MKDVLFHSRLPFDRLSARSASPATTGCSHLRNSSATSSGIVHSTTSKRHAASAPSTPPRSEWIYRTLRTPPPAANSAPYSKPHSKPTSKYHSRSTSASVPRSQSDANVRTCQTVSEDGHSVNASGSSTAPFWSNVLHPRSRSFSPHQVSPKPSFLRPLLSPHPGGRVLLLTLQDPWRTRGRLQFHRRWTAHRRPTLLHLLVPKVLPQ
ncbi:hypothetical protein CPB83DRAFT_32001 [Crepidotus variabilis]|uniref:Uncharacterized protein n=1 Tax=Crepidotus variabilis TaxID=179855 RepID=A0A9P6ET78_9AGAR|nr:hypothetical protein CPB83DRAFT_32001 [Crepidotus variabilis]